MNTPGVRETTFGQLPVGEVFKLPGDDTYLKMKVVLYVSGDGKEVAVGIHDGYEIGAYKNDTPVEWLLGARLEIT